MKRRFEFLAMMFIMILLLSSCGNTIPIELKSSIQDGTITYEKIESNNWEDIIETKEFREYFANTLTEYQKEDAVEKALDLIYEISIGYKDETYINGGYLYASDTVAKECGSHILCSIRCTSYFAFYIGNTGLPQTGENNRKT